MDWSFDSNRPIYAQIIEHIRLAIVSGELSPGSRLPSVRDLAAQAEVNPNTMQRALSELDQIGFVNTNRTGGRFITTDEQCIQAAKLTIAKENADRFFESMEKIGYGREAALAVLEGFKQGGIKK